MPLHEAIRLVAGEPRAHEGEQHALAEHEAVRRVEVRAHASGVDDEPAHEPGEAVEHVVEREERIRQDDALGARVGDVALVPEGDVLQADGRRRANDPRQSADPLGDHRVALVRHRRGALLAFPERLLHFAKLRPREVADLGRVALERRGAERQRREQLRVPVARDDLRRGLLGDEPEPLAGDPLHLGIAAPVRPHGAGELADPHPLERGDEA